MDLQSIPTVTLSSVDAKPMPVLGLGTGGYPPAPPEAVIKAVLEAIELGYRMFDTASFYQTEEAVGEAICQAVSLGLIKSRDEVFLTSKVWCNDTHADRILPALQKTLENMKLEYLDQYLIHWPVSLKPEANPFALKPDDVLPLDLKSVWTAMEECQKLGLTKSIGVSNFSSKKVADILAFAKIPPAIVQVEMNPAWQQGKLKEFCQAKGIKIAAFSPLGAAGAFWGTKGVLESEVALRWAYEQGLVVVMKSFNKERLKQNQEIFDWELSAEESKKIAQIPQIRANRGDIFVFETGPIKSVEELWDGEL
ncbi:hypothetical protein DCAR_0833093 [Daucus carota subsp. sativus]|uniref:NADP-dependent oxidoreductase domain-containing protein n=1 Tax=Daucus carota subsp. sativus TaxID=79200 RepID=A0AAF1BD57_DAUCS|nr:hypothetical protein DCAR_0833093 [Daucus carota subsp. sativus]